MGSLLMHWGSEWNITRNQARGAPVEPVGDNVQGRKRLTMLRAGAHEGIDSRYLLTDVVPVGEKQQ